MGVLNQIWWLLGVMMAIPIAIPGVEAVFASDYQFGILLLAVALAVLLLPEYIKWRLVGGSSPFERVPFLTTSAGQGEK